MPKKIFTSRLTRSLCATSPAGPSPSRLPWLALSLVGLTLTLCCTSCADLTEVAKFAASAQSACTGYSDIINDFVGSATRRSLYVRDTEKEKAEAQREIETYKGLQADMLSAQKPLVDYIAALAAISTSTPAAASKSAAASASSTSAPSAASLKNAGIVDTKEATAALGLATKVTALLTAGYRSDQAGKAIQEANPDLQDYLKGLEQIVGTDYPLRLDAEKSAVVGHYSDLANQYSATEPLAVKIALQQKEQDLAAIETRRQAAVAYVKILTDIGEGHQKLADAGQKLTASLLVSIVEPYAADIESQSIAVKKAF